MDRGPWIQTASGRQFFLLDPKAEDIFVDDIAQSLSQIVRYVGHANPPITVAQHSVLGARWFLERGDIGNARWFALHDAHEFAINDISRPMKKAIRAICAAAAPGLDPVRVIARGIDLAIAKRFDLPWPIPPEVKEADQRILADERMAAMAPTAHTAEAWGDTLLPLGVKVTPWSSPKPWREYTDLLHEIGIR